MSQADTSHPRGLRRIEVFVDDAKSPAQVLTSAPFRVDVDTSDLADGPHALRLVQTFEDGRTSERTVPFVAENQGSATVAGFEPGSVVHGRLGFDVVAEPAAGEATAAAKAPTSPAVWWYPIIAAIVFGGVWLFFLLVPTYSLVAPTGEEAAASEPAPEVDAAVMQVGEELYAATCVACHQAEGTGMGEAIPALAGNAVLADTDTVLTKILENPQHPDIVETYDAEQLASVATYVRNSWGNAYGPVSVSEAEPLVAAPEEAPEPEAEPAAEPDVEAPAEEPAPEETAEAEVEPETEAPAAEEPTPVEADAAVEVEAEAPAEEPAPEEPAPDAAAGADVAAEAAEAEPSEESAESAPIATGEEEPADDATTAESAADDVAAEAPAGGEPMYVTATSTPLEGPDGTPLGQLMLATEVTAIEDQGDATQVELVGWSMEAGPSVVFFSPDKRIQLATLTEDGQAAREILETMEDDFGTTYQQVSVRGTAASSDLAGSPDEIWATGRDLNASTCGACHAVHPPEDFTANQWPGTISSMVPAFVSPPEDELALLTKYLQYHAKDME